MSLEWCRDIRITAAKSSWCEVHRRAFQVSILSSIAAARRKA